MALTSAVRIDVHAHYYPDEYLDRLSALGSTTTAVSRGLGGGNGAGEIAARIQMMDDVGVLMQVLSAAPQFPVFADRQASIDAACLANDLAAQLVKAHPTRFAAFAAVPLPHEEASVVECGRALDDLGMVGVTLPTSVLGRAVIDFSLERFWAELDRRHAAVFIHPAGCGAESPLITDHKLTWVVGAPLEDALAVLHLLIGRVPVHYPNIRFIVAHLGGVLPFLLQRIDDNYEHWRVLPDHPSSLLRRMWCDTANYYEPALRLACEALGPERLLLGTDFPYFRGDQYRRAVSYVEKAGIAPRDRTAMLGENAVALLGLRPPATAPQT